MHSFLPVNVFLTFDMNVQISLRHAQEQLAQLNHQLQAVTEVKNEQSQAIKDLEGSLAAARVEAAQQNVADSSSAAAAVRAEADMRHLRQRLASVQQDLADLAKEKKALEGQVAHAADERIKSSEELGRAAKAMILAQVRTHSQLHHESCPEQGLWSAEHTVKQLKRCCNCVSFLRVNALSVASG